MAGKETVYTIKGNFDIKNIIAGINEIEKRLGKIENPTIDVKDFKNNLGALKTTLNDLSNRMAQGFRTPKELATFEKDVERVEKDLKEAVETASNFSIDPAKIAKTDKSFQDLRQQITKTQQEIDNINRKNPLKVDTSKFGQNTTLLKQIQEARKQMNAAVKQGGSPDQLNTIRDKFTATSGTGMKGYNEALDAMLTTSLEKLDKVNASMREQERLQRELQIGAEKVAKENNEAMQSLDLSEAQTQLGNLKKGIASTTSEMERNISRQKELSQLGARLKQLTSITSVMFLIRRGIRNIYNDIKELDKAFNEISVVTGRSMSEMWNGFSRVNQIAQQYGVTSKGVVEVQNMYYHQGLNTIEVNKRTAETLTLAKIAGLDYANATDMMTAALNGFKMSAEEAGKVTDVTAALASSAAASSQEILNALTKTASISGSAGTSFENTEVFLTKMIETTRESSENLGTALKTITARFSELKSGMDMDEDGEIADFNKVDKALKSVGITIGDSAGQMRDFDDVILELSSKWDGLDRNTQRYIATQAAGSRQQSRFIALVDDYNRLLELQTVAQNAAGTGTRQLTLAQESLETSLNKISSSWQALYKDFVDGQDIKKALDTINHLIISLGQLSEGGRFAAIGAGFIAVKTGAHLVTKGIEKLDKKITGISDKFKGSFKKGLTTVGNAYKTNTKILDRYEKTATKWEKSNGRIASERAKTIRAYQKEAQNIKNNNKIRSKEILQEELLKKAKESKLVVDKLVTKEEEEATLLGKTAFATDESRLALQEALVTSTAKEIVAEKLNEEITEELVKDKAKLLAAIYMEKLGLEGESAAYEKVFLARLLNQISTEKDIAASYADAFAKAAQINALELLKVAFAKATGAALGFLSVNWPLVLIGLALAAAIGGVALAVKKQNDEMKESSKSIENAAESASEYQSNLSDLSSLSRNLARAQELEAKGAMASAEEKEELQSILQDLQSSYPDLIQQIDDETLALKNNAAAQEEVNKARLKADKSAEGRANQYLYAAENMSESLREQISALEDEDMLGRELTSEEIAKIIKIQKDGKRVGRKKTYENYGFDEMEADKLQKYFGSDNNSSTFNNAANVDAAKQGAKVQLAGDYFRNAAAQQGKALSDNINQALIKSIDPKNLSKEEIKTKTQELINNFYDTLTDAEIAQLETDFNKAKSDLKINGDISQFITFPPGVSPEIQQGFEKQAAEIQQQLREQITKIKNDLGEGGLGLSFDSSQFDNLTYAQVQAFQNAFAEIQKDSTSNQQEWLNSWMATMNNLVPELQAEFGKVDWTDTESINNFRKSIIAAYGPTSQQVQDFNNAVANSGSIANKQIPVFDKLKDTIVKDIEKAESRIKGLGSSIKGELDFEGMVDLVTTANSGLSFDDFTATADGFKLTADKAEDARKAMIEQIKVEYQGRIADYQAIIAKQKAALATDELRIAEIKLALIREKNPQIIAAYNKELEAYENLTNQARQQIEQATTDLDNAEKAMDALDLAQEHLDLEGQKELWEANQEEIKKTADKLKDVADRLKEIYDYLSEIDRAKTLKTMQELLELDKSDLEATLDLNINPTINRAAIRDTVQNLSNQIANQGAIENAERHSMQDHRKAINSSGYAKINEFGVATYTKQYEQLRKNYINALKSGHSEQADGYKEQLDLIDKEIDKYNESAKAAKEAATKKKQLIKEQYELYKEALNKSASLERKILDVLIHNDEKELENYKQVIEEKKQAQQDYLDSVQNAIDKERQMRDLADKEEDLRKKERKLSILEMDTSGLYAGDVASLQNEIGSDRRDLQDTYVDNYIAKQQEDIDKLAEAYDRDITAWESYLEWKKTDMQQYQDAIDEIISQGVNTITELIVGDEGIGKTKAELQELREITEQDTKDEISWYQELKSGGFDPIIDAYNQMETKSTDINDAINTYTDNMTTKYGDLKRSITDVTKKLGTQELKIGDIASAWNNALAAYREYAKEAGNIEEWSGGTSGSVKGGETNSNDKNNNNNNNKNKTNQTIGQLITVNKKDLIELWTGSEVTVGGEQWVAANLGGDWWYVRSKDLKQNSIFGNFYNFKNDEVRAVKTDEKGYAKGVLSSADRIKKKMKYASGGYVDYTGPAWVDGTPGHPEAFLNAEDTRNFEQLRDILGSLMGSIQPGQTPTTNNSYQDSYKIEISVGELGENYTIDDLVDELGDKIYNISTNHQITRL